MSTTQKRVSIGVEIESFSISQPDLHIGCDVSRPRPGLSEAGERFSQDETIGTEYNSRPFSTVREALFLLKTGLRKYLRSLYRTRKAQREQLVPLLVGGWTDRFAGTHLHISLVDRELTYADAKSLAFAIHDHLPFMIATGANSPVWRGRVTGTASNRMLMASERFFAVQRRGQLAVDTTTEMCFVPERANKPPTLEVRILDSNIPEYVVTAICLTKAIAMRWLRHKPASNRIAHDDYLATRKEAAIRGASAELCWRGERISTSAYLDRFIEAHRSEMEHMDIADEIFRVMRLLKVGYNGSRVITEAVQVARQEHGRGWRRHFASRYIEALESLLSGNTLDDFAELLGVPLPETISVWLGSEDASIDE